MGEIEMETFRGTGIEESSKRNPRSNLTVEISLKKIGPSPPSRLIVPSSIKVHDLRKLIAQNGNLPIESLRLIWRGNVLHDDKNGDDTLIQLNNGDSLIVATKPKPPPKHVHDDFDDDDDDELRFQLPQSISGWKRRLFIALREKLKLPDILLLAIFSLSIKMWILIILWFILAPVAQKLDLGPLYINSHADWAKRKQKEKETTGILSKSTPPWAQIMTSIDQCLIWSTKWYKALITWLFFEEKTNSLSLIPFVFFFFKVIATGFAIIFYNLGHRQPGDVSAYSIFNEDFRELPGTLNAERLDRDIRAGQF